MKDEYYKTKESVDEYINLAKDISGIKLIQKLESYLESGSSILEIGSGPGTDWNILSRKYNVTGSDFSKEFLVRLRKNNPSGRFINIDAATLRTNDIFDGIYSNKVLHHLTNDELIKSINRQYEILNPKGIICHSFWKGKGTEIFKGMFVNYHTEESLRKYFDKQFEFLAIEEYEEFEKGDSILLIGRRKKTIFTL